MAISPLPPDEPHPETPAAAPPAADVDTVLAERVEEFQKRRSRGEKLTAETFAAAYPDYREELTDLLHAVEEIDSLGFSHSAPPPALASYPDRLGDYRLLNRLGSGGMGTVFRAMQESLKREVAVKILAPAWNADTRHSEAFENESKLIAGLRHTNIVEVYGAGQEGDYRYYVMALVHGRGLSVGQLGCAFPGKPYEKAVATVGLQAAEALAFAHTHGILHRDVKPGNLLLDNEGVVHVSDFGLATALNAGETAPLVTQSLDGTLRYMAPERLMNGVNSYAGDQYSLGLTLYELITRTPAFHVTEPGKLIHAICHSPLPPLRGMGELGAIINKATSYDEADRYPSVQAMADDLRRYLDGRPIAARPTPTLRRYLLWVRRRPAVAAWSHAAALLVLLLLGSISWGYISVRQSLRNENEQRRLAEDNARIADAALLRIFSGLSHGEQHTQTDGRDSAERTETEKNGTESAGSTLGENIPSLADARLMQDLLPYYEEIASRAEQGDDKVANACRILADISLQVEDYPTAETYYRRVYDAASPFTLPAMEAANGLATALYGQGKGKEARDFLRQHLEGMKDNAPFNIRLAAVHSMQLAAGFGMTPHGIPSHAIPRNAASDTSPRNVSLHNASPRGGRGYRRQHNDAAREWATRAAALLAVLLREEPHNATARLRRVELLSFHGRETGIRNLLTPNGESPLQLLDELLQESPDNEEYRLTYLRLSLFGQRRSASTQNPPSPQTLRTAADYAGKLLAARPGDSERIMLYLAARDRYAADLAQRGLEKEATRENERTLGVLEHLTARADFAPELRERLISHVAHRPPMAQDENQRDEELRTLLRNYDENRLSALRRLFRNRRPPRRR